MVRLTELDAVILWCLPEPGCDLPYLVWMYTFCNRDAAPSYAELDGCLRRSIQIGALPYPETGHYQLTPEWYGWVHQWDERDSVPEYGMVEFSERLPTHEWPVMCSRGFTLPPDEYERAYGRPPAAGVTDADLGFRPRRGRSLSLGLSERSERHPRNLRAMPSTPTGSFNLIVYDPVGVGVPSSSSPRVSVLRTSTLGCENDPVGVENGHRRGKPLAA